VYFGPSPGIPIPRWHIRWQWVASRPAALVIPSKSPLPPTSPLESDTLLGESLTLNTPHCCHHCRSHPSTILASLAWRNRDLRFYRKQVSSSAEVIKPLVRRHRQPSPGKRSSSHSQTRSLSSIFPSARIAGSPSPPPFSLLARVTLLVRFLCPPQGYPPQILPGARFITRPCPFISGDKYFLHQLTRTLQLAETSRTRWPSCSLGKILNFGRLPNRH
jgi:hypothetical protein